MNNIFYNAHHSPVGAFASFTLGYKGASGGLGIELAGPAGQNVYIGVESAAPGRFQALPFYKYDGDEHSRERDKDTTVIPDGGAGQQSKDAVIAPFADDEITREVTPGTDTWRAGDLEFTIYTPHMPIPDPLKDETDPDDIKKAVIPAVFVELTIDNTGNDRPRKAFFGYEGNDPYSAMRRYDDGDDSLRFTIKGIGQGRTTGIFTNAKDVVCALAFSVNELLADDIEDRLPFGLGTTGLALMTAPAKEKRTWRFAVCFHRDGIVTSGIKSKYYHTDCFMNIRGAARYGLRHFDFYKQAAVNYDKKFPLRQLSDDRRFMLSMAIKSYYGSTQLLRGVSEDNDDDQIDAPFWVVVEGGYRMINTLDLAIDHLFFEMRMNPWVVRSILEQYANDYCYHDNVKNITGDEFPGGVSFTHDMGVANVFSPPGQSAYELRNLKGCYSYMTQEQLVNWIICAGMYWRGSGDDEWLNEYRRVVEECLPSMVNRDGIDENDRDGVMDLDSCKTGGGGAEITTYDNVDTALGQARRNSYLAVKCWAAYLLLEKMFVKLGMTDQASLSSSQAERCAATILKYRRPDGTIPAILEDGNEATTLSIAEGLVYPCVAGMFDDQAFIKKYGGFVNALKKHFEAALTKGCKFPDGGWKMSKTSDNSWLSKTFLLQFIAEKIFDLPPDVRADNIHASWLLDPDNARCAFSDQIKAGKVCGSPYYPRGVTSILWA